MVGTLTAALVTTRLPAGVWSADLVGSFFHGERVTYGVLALIFALVAGGGARSRSRTRTRWRNRRSPEASGTTSDDGFGGPQMT